MKLRMLLVALFPVCAMGQSLDDGTYDVFFQEVTKAGRLEGCSLVFSALARDYVHFNGEQFILNGNVAIQTFKGDDLYFTAKLGLKRLLNQKAGHLPPAEFYVASGGYSTAGKAKFADSDVPGYRLLITDLDDAVPKMLSAISETGKFRLGFNQKPGGMDLNSTIDVSVSLTRDANGNAQRLVNHETQRDFGDCVARLADAVMSRLNKR